MNLGKERIRAKPWIGFALVLCFVCTLAARAQEHIPSLQGTALDGHAVSLPADLPGRITVLILGFGRRSADLTTAWEKPTRGSLEHTPEIGFFDMPMLAEIPGFARGIVLRSIRKQVPDVVKPNFLPLTADEAAWKHVAGFDSSTPDAAYVLLVDKGGIVRWSTHEPYTEARFASMAAQARQLAANAR